MTEGAKSSEFWLVIVCGIVMLANGTAYVNVPWDVMMTFFGLTGLYTGARTVRKTLSKEPKE